MCLSMDKKKKITVFTPTYNRDYLLPRLYNSLQNQTVKDFEWLVIDDGSSDTTKKIVSEWIEKDEIKIRYFYKENGGLHTAYNKAIENLETELAVCIDSDDYMPCDGIEKILTFWGKNKSNKYAGILGYDFVAGTNQPLGGELPDIKDLHIVDLANKYNHHRDVKVVHRSSLLKEVYPMPSFAKEKNFNPIYLFLKIDMKYPLLLLRENLCFVDYQPNGMSANIFNQYWDSPNSFTELRKVSMIHPRANFKHRFKHNIHYVAESIIAKKTSFIKESPLKIYTLLSIPFGFVLYLYIAIKKTI